MGESCLGDCNQAALPGCRGIAFFTASGLVGFCAWILVLSALTLRVPYLHDPSGNSSILTNSSSNGTGLVACLQPSMWTRVLSAGQTINVMCIDGGLHQIHIPKVSPSTAVSNSVTAVTAVAAMLVVAMSFWSAWSSSWVVDKMRLRSGCGCCTACMYLVLAVLCLFYWLYRIWTCGGRDTVDYMDVRNPFASGCLDKCDTAKDGVCDDGGEFAPGNSSGTCAYGTDCTDCGPREYPTTLSCSAATLIHEHYLQNVSMGPIMDNRRAPSFECCPTRVAPSLAPFTAALSAHAGSCALSHRLARAPRHLFSDGAAMPDKHMTGAMFLFLMAAVLAFFAMCTCLDQYLICPCLKLPQWTPGPSPFDKQPLSSESTPLTRDVKVEPPRADQPTVVVDGRQDYVRHVT